MCYMYAYHDKNDKFIVYKESMSKHGYITPYR